MADQNLWSQISIPAGRRLVREAQAKVYKAQSKFENRTDGPYDFTPEELHQLVSELRSAHYDLMCATYSYLNGLAGRFMLHIPLVKEKQYLKDMRSLAMCIAEKIPEHAWSYGIEDLRDYRHTLALVMYVADESDRDLSVDQIRLLYSRLEMLLTYLNFAPKIVKPRKTSNYQQLQERVRGAAKAMVMLNQESKVRR